MRCSFDYQLSFWKKGELAETHLLAKNTSFRIPTAIVQIYKLLAIFKITKRVEPEELKQRGKGGGVNIVTQHSLTLHSFPICLLRELVGSQLIRVRDSRC